MLELLNQEEIKRVLETADPETGHLGLLGDLRNRYPEHPFKLTAVRWDSRREGGLVDQEGRHFAKSFSDWIQAEVQAAGGNAKAVWEKHKREGLIITEWHGHTIYLTIPFGSAPEDFFQLEVASRVEMTYHGAFGVLPPKDLSGLLRPFLAEDIQSRQVAPPIYSFKRLTNVRQYVREMEETGTTRQDTRFFRDWQESSAGFSGRQMCRHWFLELDDPEVPKGHQRGFVPQWADGDGGLNLPVISAEEHGSVYPLMRALDDFDGRAGYPFAWYFYMLHRNRLDFSVGEMVAAGLVKKKIRLPPADEKILMRWLKEKYGF